ncbi:hypothetical protein HBI56_074460 [Parastagonospora nodorum]|uniref:Uncharacterized protein n=1 Tax=Phaeosphaeria nodorum (strain SN15 / ATCC MYA-4574 / FGSC 10173) TaxID=321614 RepID=A0A7U2EYX9_PHANO|nr:hypothetical protein HBH56_170520 [Parastagonospora nodorum]QRC94458.1 hypothetical protein JI435_076940 [Parastagonospora nodorum SN15]KAH3928646.1 hypothetical protein HBH54_139080 [Parastagonospora nodorum]KAH3945259.1 hypothetical protein HBH53_144430 [Parastagonospora nodorum]KAH3983917.1 hypothetical protein HBH52_059790 [Parastagonospora nodorum]
MAIGVCKLVNAPRCSCTYIDAYHILRTSLGTTVDHPQRQPPPIPCADAHPHCQSSKRPPRLQTDLLGPPILNGPVRHAPPSKASDPGPWQHRPFGNRPSSQPTAVNATALRHPSCATNVCF